MSRIYVHRSFNPWYYSFYLEGMLRNGYEISFADLLGGSLANFVKGRNDFFLYETKMGHKSKRVLIGAEDFSHSNESYLGLADVYAKVNLSRDDMEKNGTVPIGPSFGVSMMRRPKLVMRMLMEKVSPLHEMRQSMRRPYFSDYELAAIETGVASKLFYLNYPWKKHAGVTELRRQIISGLAELGALGIIDFEGGFSKRKLGYHAGLRNLSAAQIYSPRAYIKALVKGKMSVNTPAVHGCLGWKLGEYFALGRAIISLPFSNEMPEQLVHGSQIHFVENVSDLMEQLPVLVRKESYLSQLQLSAIQYYQYWLEPSAVIKRLSI
jgi:hypothetical protein